MGMGGGMGIPKGGKMDRKKSNSVTELVKIIAKEVMQDTVRSAVQEELQREISNILCELRAEMEMERVKAEAKARAAGVELGYCCEDRSGKPWSVREDSQLKEEVNYALNRMVNKHGRSTGAVCARLKKYYRELG